MINGISDTQTKRLEKPTTYRQEVRFDRLSIRMIFVIGGACVWVIAGGYQHRKTWKRPPESNEKRYLPVNTLYMYQKSAFWDIFGHENKGKKNTKKVRFFVFGVDK